MKGLTLWFDAKKGYGVINTKKGKNYFVHQSNILMDGFRKLEEDDVVEFDIGYGPNGKKQAVKVKPVLTHQMIASKLEKNNLYVTPITNNYGNRAYLVTDEDNVIQNGEQGFSFTELGDYAGFDTENLYS